MNVSAAQLNRAHNNFAARVHIKSDDEVIAGAGRNQGVEVEARAVLLQQRTIRSIGFNEADAIRQPVA